MYKLNEHVTCRCKCGHDSDHHARYSKACFKEGSDDPSVEWNVSTHTQTLPTDAFGEINFVLSESDVLPLVSKVHNTLIDNSYWFRPTLENTNIYLLTLSSRDDTTFQIRENV